MPVGAAFPPVDTDAEPSAIRAYVQAMDEFGYDHIVVLITS